MSDQSILWGHAIHFWDVWGVRMMLVGAVLAFLALAASLFSSFVLYRVAGNAQTELETKTLALGKELEGQRTLTAEANARAIEAQLALEKFRAPRTLDDAKFAMLVEKLKPFAGQLVIVGSYKDVAESANFAKRLEAAFVAAGWKLADPYFPGLAAGTGGVIVRTDPRNADAPRTAAEALAKALSDLEIPAIAPKDDIADALFLFGGDRANQVSVEVGTKY